MKQSIINWAIFATLSFIWGSSFILMKEGMETLTPYQVATIRMLSAGLVLLPVAVRAFKKVEPKRLGVIILSGLLGSFFPAFLFCIAELRIASSLAGFLNALTPIFTIIVGILVYRNQVPGRKIWGVAIGFLGMLFLFLGQAVIDGQDILYALLVVIATFFYGANINLVAHRLKDIGSLHIAAIAFTLLIPPCLAILGYTGYFSMLHQPGVAWSTLAAAILGTMGTAVATILFYILLKRAGGLFASMVTYGVPFIALLWGLLAGETINSWQIVGLTVILTGVYLTNRP